MENHFKPEPIVEYAQILIDHDEVERALLALENIPAYYRDNVPEIITNFKNRILKGIYTARTYIKDPGDMNVRETGNKNTLLGTLRGIIISQEVRRYNALNITPHVIDYGPGDYFIPLGLQEVGLKFSYQDIGINEVAKSLVEPLLKNIPRQKEASSPSIFIANEIIEHLSSTNDILIECIKANSEMPERVHLSTPHYTYDLDIKVIEQRGLPHLRAYTPNEFIAEAKKLFYNYNWQLSVGGKIMSLRGCRPDKIDSQDILDGIEITEGKNSHG